MFNYKFNKCMVKSYVRKRIGLMILQRNSAIPVEKIFGQFLEESIIVGNVEECSA